MIILTIILIILAIILIIIFSLLFINLHIQINYKVKNTEINAIISIKILKLKIFNKRFNNKQTQNELSTSEEPEKNKTKTPLKDKINEIKPLIPLIKNSKKILINFLKIIRQSIKLNKFETHTSLGLYDYVDTVKIVGFLSMLNILPNLSKKVSITTEALFGEEIIKSNGKISFKIRLFKPFLGLLKLISDKNIREIIKKIYQIKKENDGAKT
ncbi:MAG: hypothetical protein PHC65_03710 [Methanobacteriaceae archaeon]|uniref:hypothetical protein n=1 Tax=Methanobrevibacter TaxID=2172 RepID=UPI002A0BB370|nr:hypothetical protein [Methanobacteriaceae archaeon]MDD3408218.1 hypothetical protein [Methanobacteriaceae archaeon]MDD4593770.1 hypothetical protein [Methanobacteriaceae archaeon]